MTSTRRQFTQMLAGAPLIGTIQPIKTNSVLIVDEERGITSILEMVISRRFHCRTTAANEFSFANHLLSRSSEPFDLVLWGGDSRPDSQNAKHTIWFPQEPGAGEIDVLTRPFSTKVLVDRISGITGWQRITHKTATSD